MLLIVPYGIETSFQSSTDRPSFLLIVPYGIETLIVSGFFLSFGLLIVPYGIETFKSDKVSISVHALLIVPYGIETSENAFRIVHPESFNCTLWN